MFSDTKGIIFRQTKTLGGRKMLLLFTEKFGKISVGANANEGKKNKSSLAMRPFTYANYEIYQSRDRFNMNKGHVIKSFYGIGEDIDKYMTASYGLELCEKLLPEAQPAPEMFDITVDFLSTMEERKNRFETILLAYKCKMLLALGMLPNIRECINCGSAGDLAVMDIAEGGMLCRKCADAKIHGQQSEREGISLLAEVDFKALSVLYYILDNSIGGLKKLALEEDIERSLDAMIDRYIDYHLDPGKLKSGTYVTKVQEV
jgi:DNA repair protein RecO (recombination protein O)